METRISQFSNCLTSTKMNQIAHVTRLDNLVKQYNEEVENLKTELDKLRARTFPSFLQVPEKVVFADEK